MRWQTKSTITLLLITLLLAAIARGQNETENQASSGPAPAADGEGTTPDSAQPSGEQPTDGQGDADNTAAKAEIDFNRQVVYPLVCLAVGIATVLGLIILLKTNAFIALISAAMLVSLMAPGDWGAKISRVASEFGNSAGGIGIVIALAAVIGTCMLDSGAADRIVRMFLRIFGEKQAPVALMGSGFVLAIPVFFDTVFFLLVPLARSLHKKTNKEYLKYILAIGAGGAITHTLVPPTPGPLLMAENLGIDVGWMIIIGIVVALPAALAGLLFAGIADRVMKTPMRPIGNEPDPEPLKDEELPSLLLSLAPVILPVILISASTILNTLADSQHAALLNADQVEWTEFQSTLSEQAGAEGANPGKSILKHKAITPEIASLLTSDSALSDEQKTTALAGINVLLTDKKFYSEQAFGGIMLNKVAKSKLSSNLVRMKRGDVERMNRAVLESTYGATISGHEWDTPSRKAAGISNVFGNASFALLISTVIAMWTLIRQRGTSKDEMSKLVERSLMSGGVIILITAAGGAFGAMLTVAEVGDAVELAFGEGLKGGNSGIVFLLLGFLLASVLKVAQGSSTVAMIVGSGMIAAIVGDKELGFNAVYLATAIGGGSLVGSWMNDSGFWIFAKMGGLTEVEALRSWTVMLVLLGLICLGMSVLLATFMPLV
ncbi:MAG: GntP family gluconate:H+ symporter [Pirellulaceae bacterium]|jgi:GntP family gluconate:H+ symporter